MKNKKNTKTYLFIVLGLAVLAIIVLLGTNSTSTNTKTNEIGQAPSPIQANPTNPISTEAASPALSAEEQQAQAQADRAKQTIDARTDLTPYEKQLEYLKVAPITKPDIEEPLWKGSQEQFKVFKIKITPDGYVPDAIVVLKGDSVQLDFFSEKDTDVESKDLKFFIPVPANTITNVSYLTNDTGTLAFYCLNQCLGKDRIFGNVEVRPRQ